MTVRMSHETRECKRVERGWRKSDEGFVASQEFIGQATLHKLKLVLALYHSLELIAGKYVTNITLRQAGSVRRDVIEFDGVMFQARTS